jgi:hypothetical protein
MLGTSPVTPYWSLNQLASLLTQLGGNFGLSATISLLQLLLTTSAAVFLIAKTNYFQTDVQA